MVYILTDENDNSSECSFTVTVTDDEAPTITNLPADIVVNTEPGLCGAFVTWVTPDFADNCQINTSFCSRASGDFFTEGSFTVNCSVFDEAGNMTTASFLVTVEDNEAPEFDCPAALSVIADGTILSDPSNILDEANNAGCNEIEINFTLPEATDACSPPVFVNQTGGFYENGDVFPVGVHSLEYTATDFDGNDAVCTLVITVEEEPGPGISPDFNGGLCAGTSGKLCVDLFPGATYAWSDPQGNTISTQNCVQIDDVTEANAGNYTVEVQTASGCVTQSVFNLVVFPAANLTVTVAPVFCATGEEDLVFNVIDTENTEITSYAWTGPNNLTFDAENLVVPNVSAANAGIYSLTTIDANGCTAQVSAEAVVTETPDVPAITTAEQSICVGETTILSADTDAPANAVYTWTAQPAEGAGIPADSDSPQIEVTPTTGMNITYFLTVTTDGCTSEPGHLNIIQEASPAVNVTATGENLCVTGDSTFVLTETGGEATAWTWAGPNGFFAEGSSISIENLAAEDAGFYTVTAVSSIGCESSEAYELTVTEQPTGLEAAFTDTQLCSNESAVLQFSGITGADVVYTYTDAFAENSTTNTSVNLGSFAPDDYDYSVTATIDGCTSEPVSAQFSVQAAPTLNVTQTGAEDCVPEGSQILLSGSGGATSYSWTRNGTVLSNFPVLLLANVDANDSGIYTLTAATSFGCTTSVSEELNISEAVEPVSVVFSNDGCMGEVLQLQAEDNNEGLNYRWLLDGTLRYSEQNPIIDFLSETDAGDYQVIATDPISGCADTSAVSTLNVLTDPVTQPDNAFIFLPTTHIEIIVTENDDLPLDSGYTVTVFQQPEFGRIEVIDAAKGHFDYIRETDRARTDRFFYEICYDDCDEACEREMVTVEILYSDDECVTTNLISPNGDGTNDEFIIYCLENGDFNDNELNIYNQWGDRVFRAAPYNNDWTGTFEGEDLPDGTYFYTFRRDANSELKKGSFTIFR